KRLFHRLKLNNRSQDLRFELQLKTWYKIELVHAAAEPSHTATPVRMRLFVGCSKYSAKSGAHLHDVNLSRRTTRACVCCVALCLLHYLPAPSDWAVAPRWDPSSF